MNNFIQIELFDSEFPKENLKIELNDVDWQEKLGCSILTRQEISVLISKNKTEDYYIYVLWKMYTEKPIPFYVGKGHFDRVIKHEMPSDRQNKVKNNIINKHKRLGFNVGYSILSWHKEEQDALNREAELISQLGRADLKQGILTNKTDGGDGTRGHLSPKRGESHSAKPVYAMVNEKVTRFSCVEDCVEVLGISGGALSGRIRNGWIGYYYEDEGQQPTISTHQGFYRKVVHIPDGIFESLAEAGRQLNVSHKQIHKRIKYGWEGYYYVDEGQRPRRRPEKAVEIAGIKFESQKEAAQIFGITTGTVSQRLKSSNYPDWVDLSGTIAKEDRKYQKHTNRTQLYTSIWIGEIKYGSLVEAEKATGIKHGTLAVRAKSSNYPDIKIDGVVKTQRSEKMSKLAVSVTIDGVEYQTLSDAARVIGIDINTIKKRCCSLSFPNYISKDADLQKKPPKDGRPSLRRITIDGNKYRSIKAAHEAVGIPRDKLKQMALDENISNVYFEI
ncbi:MAG: NUMOD1 domain-containing DNA-binding protein [Methylococcales bacterium]|nr:NUMOD1 domain-containing DNA-binding protein [Methylococcales bacterium]MDD5753636.1 NUMOD1 domain-containing DNA-binding protein [Methylococcales bacterium]